MDPNLVNAEPDDDDLELEPPAPPAVPPPPLPGPPAAQTPSATPELSREQLLEQMARLQAAQTRNNGELAKRRHIGKAMKDLGIEDLGAWLTERGIDPTTGQRIDSATPPTPTAPTPSLDESEVERRVQLKLEQVTAQQAERATALESALRETAIRAALREANFAGTMEPPAEGQPSGLERALRVMDLSKIVVEPSGQVTGVAEAVKSLQAEIPEWFRRPTPPPPPSPRRGSVDGGDRRPAPQRPLTWEEQAAGRLSGKRR